MKLGTRKKLIVFDVEGVLLESRFGAFKEILIIFGKKKEVQNLENSKIVKMYGQK